MPMIRSGRCDECRRRKRKCDEARPSCSGCIDRDAHCKYSTEISRFINLHQSQTPESSSSSDAELTLTRPTKQPAKQVVLKIRSSREPPSGNGRYHTFVPLRGKCKEKARQARQDAERRSASISPPPCSDAFKLQSEFHDVLHCATSLGLRMQTLGRWLEMCIERIGTSPVLDRAIACLIAGHKTRYGCDERAMQSGRHRYGESLTLLRDTVAAGVKSITAEAIAATKILMVYEIMIGDEIHGWISHSYGAINLFVALGPESCKGEFERLLFYGTYAQAWQQAMMIGKPSVFDRPEWLRIQHPHRFPHGLQPVRRFHVVTKLPRLTGLVRAFREDPTNDALGVKAAKLAEELLDLDWGVDEEWQPQPELVPTLKDEDSKLVPVSFKWKDKDFAAVLALNFWWVSKIMLSGICQTLHLRGAPLQWPSLADLYQEERRCALYICMSMDYFASIAPYACVVSLQFMQCAWGSFWRQKDFPTCVDGYAMTEWLRRRGNEFLRHIVTAPVEMSSGGLAFNTERLMGGPILPPECYPSNGGKVPRELQVMHALMQRIPEPLSDVGQSVGTEGGSEFNEGIRNDEQALPNGEGKSLFAESHRNAVLSVYMDNFLESP